MTETNQKVIVRVGNKTLGTDPALDEALLGFKTHEEIGFPGDRFLAISNPGGAMQFPLRYAD